MTKKGSVLFWCQEQRVPGKFRVDRLISQRGRFLLAIASTYPMQGKCVVPPEVGGRCTRTNL